ncbi:hypothetical protein KSD_46610 [Ktedonobacter sp. SOSP1-85]|uniref:hypothetical protein n=1 Tax=Ktedonobacter sp. SOSP1-85 TaxID=2778367 RepID=UPI001916AA10|nr:hypothetical protein [Ktedonobacter sp. SOSP1-85]GHO76890.1 hypothetical protein KSD_46610 [Ktedonobacter sp. SOSP1-85]
MISVLTHCIEDRPVRLSLLSPSVSKAAILPNQAAQFCSSSQSHQCLSRLRSKSSLRVLHQPSFGLARAFDLL